MQKNFEDLIAKDVPKLMKVTNMQIQECDKQQSEF